MQHQLTLGEGVLEQLQRDNDVRLPQVAHFTAALCRIPTRIEWLVGNLGPTVNDGNSPRFITVCGEHSEFLEAEFERQSIRLRSDAPPTVVLALGMGSSAGKVGGICNVNRLANLNAIKIVQPGLPQFAIARHNDYIGGRVGGGILNETEGDGMLSPLSQQTWSRTIGALGNQAFRRIAELHVAIVGCGRIGSQLAAALNRLGVMRITLIDFDQLERHNIGEMTAVTAADLGRSKVAAVAEHLNRFGPVMSSGGFPRVNPVRESILSLAGLVSAKQADVLFCCVDDAAARLATAFIATLFLRPMIDVGTGIGVFGIVGQSNPAVATTRQHMGADVRLIVPGDHCLMCLGGVPSFEQARKTLLSGPTNQEHEVWTVQRAGSLYSLNGVAVHLAMRLLEDFMSSRIEQSTWLRMDVSQRGAYSLQTVTSNKSLDCEFCGAYGRGDDGVRLLSQLLATA